MSVLATGRPAMMTSSTTTVSFTSHLRDTINQSRLMIDQWVIAEQKRVDDHVQTSQKELATKQRNIDTTSAQLLALQLQYGCTIVNHNGPSSSSSSSSSNNNNKLSQQQMELEDKIQQQNQKNQQLEHEMIQLNNQIKELQMEVDEGTTRAKTIQQQATTMMTSKDVTVNDLTRGMINYKYLGLDFQKADQDRLKFIFTQLDPNHPNHEYSFCLGTKIDDDDNYSIFDCTPIQFSDDILVELIEPLNRTNDMSSFVRNIRNAFLQHINRIIE